MRRGSFMIEPETNIIAFKPRTNVAHHPKSLMERIYELYEDL